MIAARHIARVASRNVPRFTATSSRLASIRTPLVSAWRQPSLRIAQQTAAFSAVPRRCQAVEELVAKLDSELSIEQEQNPDSYPPEIEEFLQNSGFQLQDTPGQEEVLLKRKMGGETITVTFSVADLTQPNEFDEDAMDEEDPAFNDEEMNSQSGAANTKGSVAQGRTANGNVRIAPEDRVAPADRPELAEGSDFDGSEEGAAFPARLNVKITKEGQKGAMMFEAVAQDGDIMIENVYYFPDAKLADPATADLEWTRKNIYAGPPFGNLDQDLQIMLENYLEERGVDTAMAVFVPTYIDAKEQKEYIRWLENMKSFLL